MPRKKLPDRIERNDKSLSDATPAERDVVDKLPDLWDRHDTITAMADELGWSSSHVGACWRKYYRPVGESEDDTETKAKDRQPPRAHNDSEPSPRGSDVGVGVSATGNGQHSHRSPTVTIPVDQIPDDEREALAFIRGVKAIAP